MTESLECVNLIKFDCEGSDVGRIKSSMPLHKTGNWKLEAMHTSDEIILQFHTAEYHETRGSVVASVQQTVLKTASSMESFWASLCHVTDAVCNSTVWPLGPFVALFAVPRTSGC